MRKIVWLLLFLLLFAACRMEGGVEAPAPATVATPTAPILARPSAQPSVAPTLLPAATAASPTPSPTPSAREVSAEATSAIFLPGVIGSPEEATPTAVPPTPIFPVYDGPALDRDQLGVQVYIHRQDISQVFAYLRELDVGWLKFQVKWAVHEPDPDRYEEELMDELDELVAKANAAGIEVMLSVVKAPAWSRPVVEFDGPPTDYAQFTDFMAFLAERYQGRVAAYELWNEPNLQREWYGASLSATDFVALVRAGAEGVRRQDPAAVVISGAPAVTGINDGVTAIDDRVFLERMLAAGVADVVDGIGAHPYGYANPPDATVANPDPVATSHNNHPSFFFLDTLNDYRALLERYDVEKPLWVTEFGWGSYDNFGAQPPADAAFMADVNEQQQAVYNLRAFEMAQERDEVGPMMLWNLNFAPVLGPEFSVSGYSILRPDGSRRPAYFSLATAPKE